MDWKALLAGEKTLSRTFRDVAAAAMGPLSLIAFLVILSFSLRIVSLFSITNLQILARVCDSRLLMDARMLNFGCP